MNRKSKLLFAFLLAALSMIYAEQVPWRPCPYPDSTPRFNCTIHEVNLDPCKEAAEGKPCKLKRGITGNLTYDYTPGFSSDKMQGRVFWASEVMDIPFLGMDPDACLTTTCPLVEGQRNTYTAHITILKKYPIRMYNLKWKIWNEQGQECCFMIQTKIVK
ncbi:MD-2-related lipid-recognition protein [Andrena cerasifolii]|uniref:MD-2-related lipid-recognition protein n=1 Tax=Andrena cerasifolii TaxID=2819439 RepID=UPI00403789C7